MLAAAVLVTALSGCVLLPLAVVPPPTVPNAPSLQQVEIDRLEAGLDGAAELALISGWPYATIFELDDYGAVFHELSGSAVFAAGGTYTLLSDKHLQIVHVPTRSSDESIDAIIQLAVDYPEAEILLQATTGGPQWPMLYVARLTPEQVPEIEARLLDPALADADIEGYPMPFQLTTITADGPVYTEGNFGGVAD